VVVLHGEGPVFSAGVDLGMLKSDVGDGTAAGFRDRVRGMQAALARIETLEKPVIAAMHRYAAGLALELALACDLRVASDDCEMGLPRCGSGWCRTWAARPGWFARSAMRARQGAAADRPDDPRRTGARVGSRPRGGGQRHARRGGVSARARDRRQRAAGRRRGEAARRSRRQRRRHTFLELELWAQSLLKHTDDAREGARAAIERRPPKFTGR
jgi:enoyl-CoA hydratase/carnithine racemase